MNSQWIPDGFPVDRLWIPYEFPVDSLCIPCVFPMDRFPVDGFHTDGCPMESLHELPIGSAVHSLWIPCDPQWILSEYYGTARTVMSEVMLNTQRHVLDSNGDCTA